MKYFFEMTYRAEITYKINGKTYVDSVGVDLTTTYQEVKDMFEMNHIGDNAELISIKIYVNL